MPESGPPFPFTISFSHRAVPPPRREALLRVRCIVPELLLCEIGEGICDTALFHECLTPTTINNEGAKGKASLSQASVFPVTLSNRETHFRKEGD